MSAVPRHAHVPERRIGLVLPAAGQGSRLGSSLPKQFLFVNGQPLMCHTINSFLGVHGLVRIVIPISDQDGDLFKDHVLPLIHTELRDRVVTVTGGESRNHSIASGVRYLNKENVSIIIVHDAVRPLIDLKLLDKLITAAQRCGASGPVTSLTSTVVSMSDDGLMDASLQRSCYRESHMPQVFKADVITEAYERCSNEDLDFGTECLDLVKRYTSSEVRLIEGDGGHLWKVTYRKDLAASSLCLEDPVSEISIRHDPNDLQHKDRKAVIQKLELVIKSYSSYSSTSRRLSENGSSSKAMKASSSEFNRSFSSSSDDTVTMSIYVRFSSSSEQLECQIRELETTILGSPDAVSRDLTRDLTRDRCSPLIRPDTIRNVYLFIASIRSGEEGGDLVSSGRIHSEFETLIGSTRRSIPSLAIVYTPSHHEGTEEGIRSEIRLFSLIQSLITSPSQLSGQVLIL